MLMSVWTIARSPGPMVAGRLAYKSKPADKTDPLVGTVAFSESNLTKRGSS